MASVEIKSKNFNDALQTVREELDRSKAIACPLIRFQFVQGSTKYKLQIERWLHLHDYTVVRPNGCRQCIDVLINQDENAADNLLQTATGNVRPRSYDDTSARQPRLGCPLDARCLQALNCSKTCCTCCFVILIVIAIGIIFILIQIWICTTGTTGKYCLFIR